MAGFSNIGIGKGEAMQFIRVLLAVLAIGLTVPTALADPDEWQAQ
jgi:hypothetical protein